MKKSSNHYYWLIALAFFGAFIVGTALKHLDFGAGKPEKGNLEILPAK